jgi:hypothetical protein
VSADESTLRALADAAGISIPAEDLDPLLAALRNNLDATRVLAAVPLLDEEPIAAFDPRWP